MLPLFAWVWERYQGYPAVPDDSPAPDSVVLRDVHPTLTLDGRTVVSDENKAAFYVPNTLFNPIVTYPTPTDYHSVAAISFQGAGVLVRPLSPGRHVIHLYEPEIILPGDFPGYPDGVGFIFDNTWIINVTPTGRWR